MGYTYVVICPKREKVPTTGLEPVTSRLAAECSVQLSYVG